MTKKKSKTAEAKTKTSKSREMVQEEINLTIERLKQGVKDVFTSENSDHNRIYISRKWNHIFD